jgi:hypothetical protein
MFAKKLFDGLIIALFLALLYFVLSYTGIISGDPLDIIKGTLSLEKDCSETFKSGSCSTNKPFYCDNGKGVERPDICGCPTGTRIYREKCIQEIYCDDGAISPECSVNKPYRCIRGKLVENSTLCGCPEDYIVNGESCKKTKCDDETKNGQCSSNKPFYCDMGLLIEKSSICGCPYDYEAVGDKCKQIQRCSDGTIYDQCSNTKPYYCLNGALTTNSPVCGCPSDYVPVGTECVDKYKVGPEGRTLHYMLDGKYWKVDLTVYRGLRDMLASQRRYASLTEKVNEEHQANEITPLAQSIASWTSNKDDQARIAISMVQNIPYDYVSLNSDSLKGRYPYEVLFDNTGVCGEKAPLLALLLKELGFGVVIFDFDDQPHQAVGIKCPTQYSYRGSGYCFVESTTPTIITDDQGDYVSIGKLTSAATIIQISDGLSFDSVSKEYNDASSWNSIKSMGQTLDVYTYNRWVDLVNKYGIKTS